MNINTVSLRSPSSQKQSVRTTKLIEPRNARTRQGGLKVFELGAAGPAAQLDGIGLPFRQTVETPYSPEGSDAAGRTGRSRAPLLSRPLAADGATSPAAGSVLCFLS